MEQILLESMGVENEVNSDSQHGFTRDLIRIDRWACVNLGKFNKAKCKRLQLARAISSRNTDWSEYRLRTS